MEFRNKEFWKRYQINFITESSKKKNYKLKILSVLTKIDMMSISFLCFYGIKKIGDQTPHIGFIND